MSAILNALNSSLPGFSQQERRIAKCILQSPASLINLSITGFAEQCQVSPSTVTRFCKTFHFKGYPDFKMRLAAELAQQPAEATYQDIVAGGDLQSIATAMEANHVASITDTTRLLDMEQLAAAVNALSVARRIDLYGAATSSIVAQDFYQKLVRIGKNSTAFADFHMQITSASALEPGDVAVAVSYSGETPETIRALRCAKDSGATTISISKYGNSTLASLADLPLFSSSLEAGMRRGDMASRIAQLHIIDILFMGMVSTGFKDYVPKLENSYHNVRSYGGRI